MVVSLLLLPNHPMLLVGRYYYRVVSIRITFFPSSRDLACGRMILMLTLVVVSWLLSEPVFIIGENKAPTPMMEPS